MSARGLLLRWLPRPPVLARPSAARAAAPRSGSAAAATATTTPTPTPTPPPRRAASRYAAFDSGLDAEALQAARQWRATFSVDALPPGRTTYARSSGPGGQHVNKTETKAVTSWPVDELAAALPAVLRPGLRASRHYRRASDSLTLQAQAERARSANAAANRQKLYEALLALYDATVPGEARPEAAAKHQRVARLRDKKKLSTKKQSRRGGGDLG